MPAEGVDLNPRSDLLTFEEIVRVAGVFARNGVSRIRLTGGEPLVRKDIEKLVGSLASIQGVRAVMMTTNGMLLDRKIAAFRSAGLSAINLSLDTLQAARFETITRRPGLDRVLTAIDLAIEHGYAPLKINCVVMKGVNDDELVDFVAMTETMPVSIRFIEYMPFSGNGWSDDYFVPWSDMRDEIERKYGELVHVPGRPAATAKEFRVPKFTGTIGFISSMSDHFCDACDRLRLTADGNLKVCLFGRREVSLRDMIREGCSDAELEDEISDAVRRKAPQHAGMYNLVDDENRPMILIGG
jgi:cyclic pyranopterin phosphate synthase